MKITIETTDPKHIYDKTASVSVGHDDVCADQLVRLLRDVCLGYGYEPDTVEQMFNETNNE